MDEVNENDFIITVKDDHTSINRKTSPKTNEGEMDKFTFMQQIEQDAEERSKNKRERERIAQNFRTYDNNIKLCIYSILKIWLFSSISYGNEAFRKQNYEKAIYMYTKAIDHVKDSPILYNNRALCYIK